MKNSILEGLKERLIWAEVSIETLREIQISKPKKRAKAVAAALADSITEMRELRKIIEGVAK